MAVWQIDNSECRSALPPGNDSVELDLPELSACLLHPVEGRSLIQLDPNVHFCGDARFNCEPELVFCGRSCIRSRSGAALPDKRQYRLLLESFVIVELVQKVFVSGIRAEAGSCKEPMWNKQA